MVGMSLCFPGNRAKCSLGPVGKVITGHGCINSVHPYVCVIYEVISKAKAHNSTNPEQPSFQGEKELLGGI